MNTSAVFASRTHLISSFFSFFALVDVGYISCSSGICCALVCSSLLLVPGKFEHVLGNMSYSRGFIVV